MKTTVLSLLALAFTLSSNVVHARAVERDNLKCTLSSPIKISAHKVGGGMLEIDSVNELVIQENYNSNYSSIIVNGESVGSDAYNRGRAGSINTSGFSTNLSFSLRPIKESGQVASSRVASAYAKYKGKVIVDGANSVAITCDFAFVSMN